MRRSLFRGLTLPGPVQGGGGLFGVLRSRCSSVVVNEAGGASPAVAPFAPAFCPSPNSHGDGDALWEPLRLCQETSRSWRAPLLLSFAACPFVGLSGHRSAALAGPERPFSRMMSSAAGPSGSDEAGLPLAQPVPDDAAVSPKEAPKSHRRRKDGRLLCAAEGCETEPSFNIEGASRAFCKAHKAPGMVDVAHPRCSADGCCTQPAFNYDGEARPAYCKDHKTSGMVDIMNTRCEICVENVKTSGGDARHAYFAREGERPRRCLKHAEKGMVDVKSKRCAEPGCKIIPRFGLVGGSAMYCSEHKKPGMVDVKKLRCQHEDCDKRPCFGIEKYRPLFCVNHKSDEMKYVMGQMCLHPDCNTRASYGSIVTKPTGRQFFAVTRCSRHKLELPGHISRSQYTKQLKDLDNVEG